MRTKRMTTIRRQHVDKDWQYQIFPSDRPQDRDTSPFIPWTRLPPEVMCLISLCLMGLQEGLEPIAPDEWQVPSRAVENWTNASREAEHHDAYMERNFRYEASYVQPTADAPSSHRDIRLETPADPEQASEAWIRQGFGIIGRVDAVLRGNGEPPEGPALAQAKRVGATVVLYNLWPAKLQAIKRRPDETIDLASVLAHPPKKLRPDGFYVVEAIFLGEVKEAFSASPRPACP